MTTSPSPAPPRRSRHVRIIGPGRAGTALALALTNAGWEVAPVLGRSDDLAPAAAGVDLLVVATPDDQIKAVARAVEPDETTVVAHLSGAWGLDILAPHPRRAALHPLVALPTPELGAKRLVGGWFAVAGDPLVDDVVRVLHGRSFAVDDGDRAVYHAAAVIASNHLVALMGQVERLAASVGVPADAYLDLATATLDNVAVLGAAAALTGPAARGDEATIRRHLRALPVDERRAYRAMADAARRLAADRRRARGAGEAADTADDDASDEADDDHVSDGASDGASGDVSDGASDNVSDGASDDDEGQRASDGDETHEAGDRDEGHEGDA